MIKFNINDIVKVKLNDKGREIIEKQNKLYKIKFPDLDLSHDIKEDDEGYSKWQLWFLMKMFGNHIGLGIKMPFETELIIIED